MATSAASRRARTPSSRAQYTDEEPVTGIDTHVAGWPAIVCVEPVGAPTRAPASRRRRAAALVP